MATIYIDNKPYEVKDGQNLLHACLSLGFDIPYFCWHPAMHSVGACRQCAVKQFRDEKDTQGKVVMSCMTPAADGTRISIDDPEAKAFRASVIEWLMLNHPHDCPVCDEGGECHLQDMTVMTGHVYRQFRFKKRTYRNQYLGPFINHEMNRCIQCYRCVRFYRGYAGGRDLEAFASHNHVYFGRHEDGALDNEFSGNLVEVCPTGVFTDKTLKKHYTRKWDLQTAPSICVHCGVGCNTIPGERYGALRRILNRYNYDLNGYFLCDRGRFGYEFVNSDLRIRRPLLVDEGRSRKPVSGKAALRRTASLFRYGAKVIGIGSPRASLEANFGLRALVGPDRFYSGMSDGEFRMISSILSIFMKGPAGPASLRDAREADAVFVLGEDVTNTAPLLALALRQSVRNKPMETVKRLQIPEWHDSAVRTAAQNEKGPLFVASCSGTKLDDAAALTHHGSPDDLARLGFAVAREIDPAAPRVPDLPDPVRTMARGIAASLRGSERPLIVSGTGCGSEALIHAAADIAWALCKNGRPARLSFAVHECNSIGLGLMGGGSLDDAFDAVEREAIETVVILENDLYRRADAGRVERIFDKVKHVIVVDHLMSATAKKAELALPAASFAEADGTLVNNEGRAQRFFQVFVPEGDIQESWRWLRDMLIAAGRSEAAELKSQNEIISAIARALPLFRPVLELSPAPGLRIPELKIPRQPHRYSGRTAMFSNLDVHEPKPPEDPDSALSFSMEGFDGRPPAPFISRYWAPGWNSVQALNKFQGEVGGPLAGGDPGRHLIEPPEVADTPYFGGIPSAFRQREGEWLLVPVYHIFGSEELSRIAPGIGELSPKPYLSLSPRDASKLKVGEGDSIELFLPGSRFELTVKLVQSLSSGIAGMPVGLPGLPYMELPEWGRIKKKT